MVLNLAAMAIDALSADSPVNLELVRKENGQYINGRWITEENDPISFSGTIHAVKDKELKDFPEELRMDDMRVIHTRFALRLHSDTEQPDIILYNNNKYRIIQIRERIEGGFYRVVIGRNHARANAV